MKKKKMKKFIKKKARAITLLCLSALLISIIFVMPANVKALGISPAKKTIPYKPGVQEFEYIIINNEHKTMDVSIYAIGELADYVKIKKPKLKISSNEGSKKFKWELILPETLEKLKPGKNIGKIVIEEELQNIEFNGTKMWAKLKVISKFYVNVPYPKKYIEADLKINKTKIGKPISIVTKIKNLGQTDIKKLWVTYVIFSNLGGADEKESKMKNIRKMEDILTGNTIRDIITGRAISKRYERYKIEEVKTETRSLKKGEITEFLNSVDTKKLKPGVYTLLAIINYDNKILELGKDFKVGDAYIEISDFTKYFLKDEINKFDIGVESRWNKKIRDTYGKIDINKDGLEIANLRTPAYDLDPYEKKVITTYWDTHGIELGTYNANITLFYLNKTSNKQGEVYVISSKRFYLLKSKYFIVLIISLSLIIFIIKMHKKIKRKNRKKIKRGLHKK